MNDASGGQLHASNGIRLRDDPLAITGLALLAILTLAVVLVYRSTPQSLGEAGNRVLLTAVPDNFSIRATEAENRLRSAEAAAAAGNDTLAYETFLAAEQQTVRALQSAATQEERQRAVDLRARAMLGRADLLRLRSVQPGLQPDDREGLATAILLADSAIASEPSAPIRARGEALRDEIQRQRRIGPLEWLPIGR